METDGIRHSGCPRKSLKVDMHSWSRGDSKVKDHTEEELKHNQLTQVNQPTNPDLPGKCLIKPSVYVSMHAVTQPTVPKQ